ncbi:MAG: hypothetical protein KDE46_17995, partial [Caldilineaceae bacterium]|nr:hypothetical protein [Caldilineaceae bacterium]
GQTGRHGITRHAGVNICIYNLISAGHGGFLSDLTRGGVIKVILRLNENRAQWQRWRQIHAARAISVRITRSAMYSVSS